jgi:hypothetical protein
MVQLAQNTVRISPPTDRAVMQFFADEFGDGENIQFQVSVAGRDLGSFQSVASFELAYKETNWSKSRIISSIKCTPARYAHIVFQRWTTKFNQGNPVEQQASNWENELYLDFDISRPPDAEKVIYLWRSIENFRSRHVLSPAIAEGASSDLRKLVAEQIAQLSDLQVQIVEKAESSRQKSVDEIEARRNQLEAEWNERRRELESAASARLSEVDRERKEFEAAKKELDDRGHMHARRELRTQITSTLKARLQRPGVSAQSSRLRLWFVSAVLGGISISAGYAIYETVQLNRILVGASNASIYVVLAAIFRTTAPILLVTALLFYLLTWLKRTHTEDVNAERELERYSYDIDRASWAIETILEVQTKESGEVPSLWIEGVTRSLFTRATHKDEDRDALDALGSLLNLSAKAEIGPNGPRFELGRSGLRRLGKAAASDGE